VDFLFKNIAMKEEKEEMKWRFGIPGKIEIRQYYNGQIYLIIGYRWFTLKH